jgi:ABC-type protease/lipase transport system fused ATPase/permease subunit
MGLFKRRTTSRAAVADLDTATVDADGRPLALAEALVAARVDGAGLAVIVHHPAFAELSDQLRVHGAVEILIATLGEDVLRQVVTQVDPATHPPIDPFGLPALRAFVRSVGVTVDVPGA